MDKDSGVEVCYNTYNMPLNYVDNNDITTWCGYTINNHGRDDLSEEGLDRVQSLSLWGHSRIPQQDEQPNQEQEDDDEWRSPATFQYVSTWAKPPPSYTPTYNGFQISDWRLAPVHISLASPF